MRHLHPLSCIVFLTSLNATFAANTATPSDLDSSFASILAAQRSAKSPADFTQPLQQLQDLAAHGHVPSLLRLADMYTRCYAGAAYDPDRAEQLLTRAVAAGSSLAHLQLAALLTAPGSPLLDSSRAEALLAELRMRIAPRDLADPELLYIRGILAIRDNPPDFAAARADFRRAHELHFTLATFDLARSLLSKAGGPVDPAAARRLFDSIADDDPSARAQLAFLDLAATPPDLLRYFHNILAAAKAQSAPADLLLADCYITGRGTAKDPAAAFNAITHAAGLHYPQAAPALARCHLEGIGTPKDTKAAVAILEDAAAQRNPYAALALGKMYQDGTAVPRDYDRAFPLVNAAANTRLPAAIYDLGWMYECGESVPKNPEKAFSLYKSAALAGEIPAMHRLGVCYYRAIGTPRDDAQSIHWYSIAVDAAYAPAMCSLAHCYQDGRGVARDFNRAVELYQRSAALGNANAMHDLAICYERGVGVPKDDQAAFALFKKAADLHDPASLWSVGHAYANGRGCEKNLKLAVTYFEKASDAGDPFGMESFARALRQGALVPQDLPRARQLLEKALDAGDSYAAVYLAQMYLHGEGGDTSPDAGIRLLRQAAEAGPIMSRSSAMMELGYCYAKGLGVPLDLRESFRWYKLSAEAGEADGMYALAWRYLEGRGTDKDVDLGISWLLKAAPEMSDPKAFVELANLYQEGKLVPKDPAKVRDYLQAAADRHHRGATLRLANLYRDGSDGLPVDNEKSQALLHQLYEDVSRDPTTRP